MFVRVIRSGTFSSAARSRARSPSRAMSDSDDDEALEAAIIKSWPESGAPSSNGDAEEDEDAAAPDAADAAAAPAAAAHAAPVEGGVWVFGVGHTHTDTSTNGHVKHWAPSGVVDLSERSLRTQMELNCFHSGVIPADVAAGIWCVDLSHNGIAAIPPSMTKPLTGLQDLNLSHNMISDFPSCLCNLPSLTTLDLSLNLLESIDISAELVHKGLPNLEALLLSKNHLRQLPPCLAGCKSLTKLDLGHNRLGFAMTFGGGSKGNTPRGGETGAGFIPTATMVDPLPGAAHLTELYLNDNGLLQVPNAVWGLKELSLLKQLRSDGETNGQQARPKWVDRIQ